MPTHVQICVMSSKNFLPSFRQPLTDRSFRAVLVVKVLLLNLVVGSIIRESVKDAVSSGVPADH